MARRKPKPEWWDKHVKVTKVKPEKLRSMFDMPKPPKVTRIPVKFNYTGLNWDFLKLMAEIVPYADEKYTSFAQYTHARLTGQASPENHIAEHLRQYMMDEPYDHFDGDRGRHLVAIAYNAMMAWYYLKKFGPETHPLKVTPPAPANDRDRRKKRR